MIILEFADAMVHFHKRAPASICAIHGPLTDNAKYRRYLELADRIYSLNGTKATMIKDRYGGPSNFEISGEDAVALVLKAVVL